MSEKVRLASLAAWLRLLHYGKGYAAIVVYILIDVLTSLQQFLHDIQAGTLQVNRLSMSIWLCATGISVLNTIKASQSGAWHRATTQPEATK